MKATLRTLAAALLAALAWFPSVTHAQLPPDIGKVDPTFTPWPEVAPPNDLAYGYPKAFILLDDGGVISAPTFGLTGTVRKLLPNGRPDPNFTPAQFTGDLLQQGNPPPEIFALVRQASGKIIFGGSFSTTPFAPIVHLARLNANGTPDLDLPLPELDGPVHSLLIQPDGRILVGGSFTTVGGVARGNLARLNEDGTMELLVTPPVVGIAGVSSVRTLAQQIDGVDYVVLGGSFTTVGGVNRFGGVARLRLDDLTLDPSFLLKTPRPGLCGGVPCPPSPVPPYHPLSGPSVVAVQPDQKILVAGALTPITGSPANIYRFDSTGLQDTNFAAPVMGPLGSFNQVNHLALQADGKVIIGGRFGSIAGMLRRGIARLNADSALDTTFNPRAGLGGAAPSVERVALLANGDALIGGVFDVVNLVPSPLKPGLGMARLYGDSITRPPERTLTVQVVNLGGLPPGAVNRVTNQAAGYPTVVCTGPSACASVYREGDRATLQATPAAGWRLKFWTVDGSSPVLPPPPPVPAILTFLDINAHHVVVATFEPLFPQFHIVVNVVEPVGAGGQVKVEHVLTSFPNSATTLGTSTAGDPFDQWRVNDHPSYVLRFTAVPPPGHDVNWAGITPSGSGLVRTIGALTTDHNITVTFTPRPHTVTVNVVGQGNVTSPPAGINCNGPTVTPCEHQFSTDPLADGILVTLTATPTSTDYSFDGWTDLPEADPARLNSDRVVTTAGDAVTNVTARFVVRNRLTVGFTGSGGGAITTAALSAPGPAIICHSHPPGPMACSGDYESGTEVTLRAVANSDSVFFGWLGDGANVASGQRMVSMVGSKNVTAEFRRLYQFNPGIIGPVGLSGGRLGIVTFYPGVPGEIVDWCASAGADGTSRHCAGQFPEGSWVTLEVSPPPGTVVRWIWTGPVEDTIPPNINRKRVQITADNIPVMASYVPQVSLNVNVAADAGGTVTSEPAGINSPSVREHLFDQGETVTLTAHPMAGWRVANWDGGSDAPTLNQRVVTLTGPQEVTATFVRLPPNVTAFSPEAGPVLAGRADLELHVTASGADLEYEWFKQPPLGSESSLGVTTAAYVLPAGDVVPASEGTQYRVRVSNTGGFEDRTWTLTFQRDFGDAPASDGFNFPTLQVNDGARHVLWAGGHPNDISLAGADAESDGQPDPLAGGDDNVPDSADDENGVGFTPLYLGQAGKATVFPTGNGKISMWIDWNGDGQWSNPEERVVHGVTVSLPMDQVTFTVPADIALGFRFARVRFSRDTLDTPTGDAPDGEVEDHRVEIRRHPIVGLPASLTVPKNYAPFPAPYLFYVPFQVDVGLFHPPTLMVNPGDDVFVPDQPSIVQLSGPPQHELVLTLDPDAVGTANLTISVVPLGGGPAITTPFTLHVADELDADGIAAAVENFIPVPGGTTGDGNRDGTPDGEQLHVASFESLTPGHFITLVVADGLRLVDVSAELPPTGLPSGYAFAENTLLGFRVEGLSSPGLAVTVEQIFHAGLPAGLEFYKYGRPSPGAAPAYYAFPLYTGIAGSPGEHVGYVVAGNTITLHLQDGLLGDDDWIANGVIQDPGGPVVLLPTTPPALSIEMLPGQQARISWPEAGSAGLVLKSADSLTPPVAWQTDPATVTTDAGFKRAIVDLLGGARFYRLAQP